MFSWVLLAPSRITPTCTPERQLHRRIIYGLRSVGTPRPGLPATGSSGGHANRAGLEHRRAPSRCTIHEAMKCTFNMANDVGISRQDDKTVSGRCRSSRTYHRSRATLVHYGRLQMVACYPHCQASPLGRNRMRQYMETLYKRTLR